MDSDAPKSGTVATTMWVLVTRSEVEEQWIAHCLNIDVVTTGDSIGHAFEMAREAVMMAVEDDLQHDRDPLGRSPAPSECWQLLHKVNETGRPLIEIEDHSKVGAVVGRLLIEVPRDALPDHANVEMMPPVWQLAALQNMRNDQHPC